MSREFKDEVVDWKKLWNILEQPTVANGEDVAVDVTPCEEKALTKFAEFLGKMNPPEDDRIPLKIRKENDVKFKEVITQQFKYLSK